MLLKALALQNQVVECGPSLLNLLSHSQIGQERGKKKLNYLFSTLAFSQFSISSRLLPNHECFSPPPPYESLFIFSMIHIFSCNTPVPLDSVKIKPWKMIFVLSFAQKLSLLAF